MKISVVVPAYNEAGVIEACLASLVAQTRPADEIIVVDNNSTDDTARIAKSYGAKVILEKTQGICAASRAGYNNASGDIFARCDSDSRVPQDWLERIEADFTKHPDISAVTGPGTFYDLPSRFTPVADALFLRTYFAGVGVIIGRTPLYGSNMAMRRSAWEEAHADIHHREDVHDDMELTYHLKSPIFYDKNLRVAVSSRPLKDPMGVPKRYKMGAKTVLIHWPKQLPWRNA